MMSTSIDFLLQTFRAHHEQEALIWKDRVFHYGFLLQRLNEWNALLASEKIAAGTVVLVEADYSPNAVALLLALIAQACIVVPLTSTVDAKKAEFIANAEGEVAFAIDEHDNVRITRLPNQAQHPHYQTLRQLGHPGLVLFSSGSTGKSKAAVHDFARLLEKFKRPRKQLRAITFLLYDHIGGVNTLFYTLSNAGCVVTVQERTPDAVLQAIAKHRVEILPTSPTFLNLILLSEAYRRYQISTLQMITYGTEPMPESTLKRIHEIFPRTQLLQTYGLSELGILRSKSKDSCSLWVKLGGEGFETKVVNGTLCVRARSAMLGYLNAPSPFDAEGWMNTGDVVETEGDYFRILGRNTEIINVGGQKVHPVEVESVLMQMDNLREVTVYGEKNPITGNLVAARVQLREPEDLLELKRRIQCFCRDRLPAYMIPARIEISANKQFSARYKKLRANSTPEMQPTPSPEPIACGAGLESRSCKS